MGLMYKYTVWLCVCSMSMLYGYIVFLCYYFIIQTFIIQRKANRSQALIIKLITVGYSTNDISDNYNFYWSSDLGILYNRSKGMYVQFSHYFADFHSCHIFLRFVNMKITLLLALMKVLKY